MKNEILRVGVIASTHGLRGEVKVFPTTEYPERFDELEDILLDTGRGMKELKIRSVRYFKQFVILAFEGLDRIEDVQPFLKKELYVSREDALSLGDDEYYIADLIGLAVIDETEGEIGRITDVLETGANDVYVVKTKEGELLLPAIHSCIMEVNVDEGYVRVRVPAGLR